MIFPVTFYNEKTGEIHFIIPNLKLKIKTNIKDIQKEGIQYNLSINQSDKKGLIDFKKVSL